MKFGIGAKIALLSIILVALAAGTVGLTSSAQTNHLLMNQELGNLKENVSQDASPLVNYLDVLKDDLHFQTGRRLIQAMANSDERWMPAEQGPAVSGASILGLLNPSSAQAPFLAASSLFPGRIPDSYEEILSRSFVEALQVKPQYVGMHLIRTSSHPPVEVAGASRRGQEKEFTRVENKLLAQAPEYFEVLKGLRREQVYFSRVEQVQDNASGESQFVIRAATPIVNKRGNKPYGILVVDTDLNYMVATLQKYEEQLQRLRVGGLNSEGKEAEPRHKTTYVSDDQGRCLFPPSAAQAGQRLQDRYPELAQAFQPGQSVQPRQIGPDNPSNEAGWFLQVALPGEAEGRFLGLAVVTSHQQLEDEASALGRTIKRLTIILLIGAIILAYFFARILTRPVTRITRAAQKLAQGQFDTSLPVEAQDEIGILARTFKDMAEQVRKRGQELQEREARIRTIVETAAEGIITMDAGGAIQSFNQAAEKIFGYQATEIIGHSAAVLMDGPQPGSTRSDSTQRLGPIHKKLLGATHEVLGRRKNGQTFPMELASNEVALGQTRFFTSIVRDITERKQTEKQIRQLNERLEQRVVERTAALQQANEDLEVARDQAMAANQTKSAFLAQMSHELRTPLNAIIGYSELLKEEVEERQQPDLTPDLTKIIAAGKHLLALINDILDLSKIEAGKMDLYLESFELQPLLQDVRSTVEPLVRKNGNTLELTCGDHLGSIHADRTRLRQILFNMLSNACKFTDKGRISLDVQRRSEDGGEWVLFEVHDTGIGMTAEQLGRLFQPFTQADASTTRKYEGTGLGLTISRRFCQMMGGDIFVTSEFGKGSTFTVRLPSKVVKPQPPPAAAAVSRMPATHRPGAPIVLVIDDEQVVHEMMERILGKHRFQVVTATSGEEGLRLARELHPQVITLDVMMPSMDGWSVLSALKADPTLADIPVVMLTIVEHKNLGYALGAADYLTKPLDRNRLLSVLKKHCKFTSPGVALVVEDDESSREMLRRMLEKDSWTVVEAANGISALECVARQQPALILLDLMMPEMDGFEFLTELRQHPEWQAIPVVVVTAKDLTEEDRMFLNSSLMMGGCVKRILHKGAFNREDLLREVHDLIVAYAGDGEAEKIAEEGKDGQQDR